MDIKGYREKLLNGLRYLNSICEDYSLRYYAIGGTFLGAVRHNGFIPWDNDIDVCMPRNDYYRFEKIVNEQKGIYFVETPQSVNTDYCYSVAKMYDTTTTVVENIKYKTKRGVYIDIFPLDGIGNTLSEVKTNYGKIDFMNMIFTSRTSVVRPGRERWKNYIIRFASILPSHLINEKKLVKKLDNMCARLDYENNAYVGVLLTQYRKKYIMEKRLFEDIDHYRFEDIEVVGVKDYETYLTNLYGNWRALPPADKQVVGHDFSYVDLNHSYLED